MRFCLPLRVGWGRPSSSRQLRVPLLCISFSFTVMPLPSWCSLSEHSWPWILLEIGNQRTWLAKDCWRKLCHLAGWFHCMFMASASARPSVWTSFGSFCSCICRRGLNFLLCPSSEQIICWRGGRRHGRGIPVALSASLSVFLLSTPQYSGFSLFYLFRNRLLPIIGILHFIIVIFLATLNKFWFLRYQTQLFLNTPPASLHFLCFTTMPDFILAVILLRWLMQSGSWGKHVFFSLNNSCEELLRLHGLRVPLLCISFSFTVMPLPSWCSSSEYSWPWILLEIGNQLYRRCLFADIYWNNASIPVTKISKLNKLNN